MCANFAHVLCSSNSFQLNTLRMCLEITVLSFWKRSALLFSERCAQFELVTNCYRLTCERVETQKQLMRIETVTAIANRVRQKSIIKQIKSSMTLNV